MDQDVREIIINDILPLVEKGELALFLGAGTSIGTPSINRMTIPSTKQLIERICQTCGYEESEYINTDLQTAFGTGQDEIDNFENFLISNFMCERPLNWQLRIFRLWWRIIFTTNIDDVPEKCIEILKKDDKSYPDYHVFNYLDREPVFRIPTSPEVVKLHGCVNKAKEGFVFDSVSYADNTVKQSDWISRCALHITHGHCLFVGSKFKESDIEFSIRQRKNWDKEGSNLTNWIVLNDFSLMEEKSYLRRGIKPIKCSAEELFNLIFDNAHYVSPTKFIKRKAPFLSNTDSNSKALAWFSENLESVRDMIQHWSSKTGPYTRFYFGDMPDWFYISHNVPAKFSSVDNILQSTLSFKNSNEKACLINIIGSVGSGKTTVALQALAIMSQTQNNVYNFMGINGIHIDHLWNVIKDVKGLVVIYIDSAANHFYAVNDIIQRALDNNTGCKLCIITEDRSVQFYRNYRHLYQIPSKITNKIIINTLSRNDAASLLSKSDSLGVIYEKLKDLTNEQKINKIISFDKGYNGDLLATLYDLSSGESYRKKLNDEYQEINTQEARSIYETISLVTACKLPLPLNYLSETENISISSVMKYLNEDLEGKVHIREHGNSMISTTARHYTIAEFHLTKCFSKEKVKNTIIKLMRCMSKKFTIDDIKMHPISYRIYRSTLSYHFLSEQIFSKKEDYKYIHEIYSTCQSLYSHDGVFWLQYGRFLEKDSQVPEALHCFRRGLDLYDSFQTRHALGHLLLKKYRTEGMKDESEYMEGISWLEGEIKSRATDSYSYTSLCSELTKIILIDPLNIHAIQTLQKYVSLALNENCFGDDALIRTITKSMQAIKTIPN
ncbi:MULTISPECIES: P-loop NTPase [Yersinia]|uniref:P-loop NTPase n=1 Tax=Yersinia TaxID=629 RepID=UPI0011A5CB07|nr:SIR2 family protein [Yersinia rohdei]